MCAFNFVSYMLMYALNVNNVSFAHWQTLTFDTFLTTTYFMNKHILNCTSIMPIIYSELKHSCTLDVLFEVHCKHSYCSTSISMRLYEYHCVWRLFLFRMGIRESQKWSWRTISELAEGSHLPISSLYYPQPHSSAI